MEYNFACNEVYFNDATHTYFVNGTEKISCTKFIQNFDAPFPMYFIAERVANKEGCTKEEVIKRWQDNSKKATTLGTLTHKAVEDFINDGVITEGYERLIENITKIPTFTTLGHDVCEQQFYYKDVDLCGTFDYATFDGKGNFILNDFKTGKDISSEKQYSKYMKYPLNGVLNSNYNKYSIQLTIYKRAIESFGFNCLGAYLIHINENQETLSLPILNMDKEVDDLFDYWTNTLKFDIYYEYSRFSKQNNANI